jgi:hypothetical protein
MELGGDGRPAANGSTRAEHARNAKAKKRAARRLTVEGQQNAAVVASSERELRQVEFVRALLLGGNMPTGLDAKWRQRCLTVAANSLLLSEWHRARSL